MIGDGYRMVYEHLPAGVLIADLTGRVVSANRSARALLGPALERDGLRCCDLFGCRLDGTPLAGACVTELALGRGAATAELRVETRLDRDIRASMWLTAAAVGGVEAAVAFQVRPAPVGDRRRRAEAGWERGATLRIRTLGRTRLAVGDDALAGEWLTHRPGELLKYLVAARGRVVSVDELLETFWPEGARASATNVRQAIHTLRDRLEPGREKHRPSAFVVGRRGGYELDPDRVRIDADEFEAAAREAVDALASAVPGAAEPAYARAAALYRGEFLADEPYSDWVIAERERLRDLAAQVLRGLTAERLRRGDPEGALAPLQRLAEIDPFDDRSQRELLGQLLRLGRNAEAHRRYEVVRRRFRRAFGSDPAWALAELVPY